MICGHKVNIFFREIQGFCFFYGKIANPLSVFSPASTFTVTSISSNIKVALQIKKCRKVLNIDFWALIIKVSRLRCREMLVFCGLLLGSLEK